jgi:hypothetical protein
MSALVKKEGIQYQIKNSVLFKNSEGLVQAVKGGLVEDVTRLLKEGANPNSSDDVCTILVIDSISMIP